MLPVLEPHSFHHFLTRALSITYHLDQFLDTRICRTQLVGYLPGRANLSHPTSTVYGSTGSCAIFDDLFQT